MNDYLIVPSESSSGVNKRNNHYRDCVKKGKPYALIVRRKNAKWATVSVDLICMYKIAQVGKVTQEKLLNVARNLVIKMKETMKLPKRFSVSYGVGIYTFISPVPSSLAEEIIKELLDIVNNAVRIEDRGIVILE